MVRNWNLAAIRHVTGTILFEAAAGQLAAGIEDLEWHTETELAHAVDCPIRVIRAAMRGITWEDDIGKVGPFLIERAGRTYRAGKFVNELPLEWDGRRPPDTRPSKGAH